MTAKALLFGLCCASGWLGIAVSLSTKPRKTMTTSALPAETVASPFVQSLPPLPRKSRRIVLLRHGETDWNSQGLLQGGGYDVELNEAGRKQAASAAQQLLGLSNTGVVASSHLERSSQTADVLARTAFPDAVRVISHKFGEMRFGEFEGLQIRRGDHEGGARNEEVEAQRRKFLDLSNILHENRHVAWPGGGESVADVEKRGQEGIQQLLRSFPDCNQFCIVAHGRFNKLLLMSLLGMSGKSDVFQQGNACINVLDVDQKGHWKACLVNHMEHIDSATAQQSPS